MNANTKEYLDGEWERGVKKFPVYAMNRIYGAIPDGASVLDIGCGNGKFLKRLQMEKGCTVYGLDISPVAIEKLRSLGMEGEVWNAENMDAFTKEFDVVIASHVFEHVENDTGLARNVARITKQFAIIAVPNDCAYPEHTGEHVRKYNKGSLIFLLQEHFNEFEDITLKKHLILKCSK